MAKGQMRPSKEKRKPKSAVPKNKEASAGPSPFATPPPKKAPPPKTAG